MWLTMAPRNYRRRIRNNIHIPELFVPFVRWMQKFFIELCKDSNIHGLRYFTERFLHWSERLWWIIAVGISLWLCSSMIQNIWIQWNEKPVTMQFNEKKVSITTIPFPTVTICPETKLARSRFDLFLAHKYSSYLSDKGVAKLNALSHICPLLSNSPTFKENFTSENIYDIIQNVALGHEESIGGVQWKNEEHNRNLMVPILTDEGLCFSFNALNSHEMYTDEMAPGMMIVNSNPNISHWSLEHGYEREFVKGEYPFRYINSPEGLGLNNVLTIFKRDFENQCKENSQSFKVTLTEPGELPKMSQNFRRIPLAELSVFWLNPKLTTTSEGLRNYKPSQRQCFFNSERRLRFYKIYTQSNCAEECLSNFTKQECGCVKFSMSRDRNTKICGTAKIKCFIESEYKILVDKTTKQFRDECNCLPACTSIRYDVEIERIHIDWDSLWKGYKYKDVEHVFSFFDVFVKNRNVDMMIRMETYTFTDFLAICGGLLGLFLGISALSIIELIYYFTLRLFWIVRQTRFDQIIVSASDQHVTNSVAFQYIQKIQTFFVDFCKNSNIHGVRYFTERRLHLSERLWWFIAVSLSVWLCGSEIRSIWLNWNENPTIMSNNEKRVDVSTIPFPTVIICTRTKVMKTKFDIDIEFNESYNPNESELARINDLSHICYNLAPILKERNFWRKKFTNESIYDTIRDVAPQVNDLFYKCSWQGKVIDCSKYFIPIMTNEGLCFTFNALNSHEIYTSEMATGMMIAKDNPNVSHWSLSNGYENNLSGEKYPFRSGYSGKGSAIDIVLQLHERDIFYRCQGLHKGFMIILTTPGEAKSIFYKDLFKIGLSEEIHLDIIPKMVTTSEGLRNYGPKQRQCFYQSERQLSFFKLYTHNNCEEECIANYTKLECGCVKFSMPRDNNTKICGEKIISCYQKVIDKMIEISSTKTFLDECNCLPSCTLIEYNDANMDRVKINMTAIKNVSRLKKDINEGTQPTRISIYFKEQQFEVKERMEKYSFIDFLAICGGLLGLFLGISALSIIELLYFFTLRMCWIIRRGRIGNAVVPP